MHPPITALPIVVPFLAAAALVAVRPITRRWVHDGVGLLGSGAVVVLCALLLARSAQAPIAYWMGGFTPIRQVSVGISLSIDPIGAGMATFSALLVLAALLYSVRYFDEVDGLFQALMLLFGAAMVGFCLTGDLFNLIVFFELMGAAAYAMTGYLIEERAPIQGAINFAITNSVAGYAMLIGLGLLYARTGALNMAQIGLALDHHSADPLTIVAMALLFIGFLTKAAAVPVHFWMADAYSVAPIPVCVLLAGAMTELGVYAIARLYWVIFAGPMGAHAAALRAILVAIGVVTTLLGGLMCFQQRHIKRLLAFSSVTHVGLFICGIGLLDPSALAGVAVYVIGHGLTKGALFMCVGSLKHRFATVDEYELHGRGRTRQSLPVAIMFTLGGLLLAALPPFTLFAGKSLLEESATSTGYAWLIAIFIIGSAATGAAVLRVSARVFLGWGPSDAQDAGQVRPEDKPEEEMSGGPQSTPAMMLIVPAILLIGALVVGLIPGFVPAAERFAARFTDHAAYAAWVLRGQAVHWPVAPVTHVSGLDVLYSALSVLLAITAAAIGLFGRPWQARIPAGLQRRWLRGLHAVRDLHSGHIGDYIAWWTAAASLLGAVCLVALG